MEMWLAEHWFDVAQTLILGTGLFATAATLRTDVNARKVQNFFTLASGHREIWSVLYDRPQLYRILELNPDLTAHPVTSEEDMFVHFLILHLRASFKTPQCGLEFGDDSVGADVRDFFSRPIPRQVWANSKKYQDPAFVKFVDSNL